MQVRKERSDKRIRVSPSLTKEYHDKLQKLALSCGYMTKTELAGKLIMMCLDHDDIVSYYQDRYNNNPALKIHLAKQNGKTHYLTSYDLD